MIHCLSARLRWCRAIRVSLRAMYLHIHSSVKASWIAKAERYFKFGGYSDGDKLDLASISMDGDALSWYNWERGRTEFTSWRHFKKLLLARFDDFLGRGPSQKLFCIKQTGSIAEFIHEFEELASKVTGLSEVQLEGIFLNGLTPSMKEAVLMMKPRNLSELFSVAKTMETSACPQMVHKEIEMNQEAESNPKEDSIRVAERTLTVASIDSISGTGSEKTQATNTSQQFAFIHDKRTIPETALIQKQESYDATASSLATDFGHKKLIEIVGTNQNKQNSCCVPHSYSAAAYSAESLLFCALLLEEQKAAGRRLDWPITDEGSTMRVSLVHHLERTSGGAGEIKWLIEDIMEPLFKQKQRKLFKSWHFKYKSNEEKEHLFLQSLRTSFSKRGE